MALIKCSECGQMVSDKATKCPNCGNPINGKSKTVWKYLMGVLCLIAILFLCWWLYNGSEETKGNSTQDSIAISNSELEKDNVPIPNSDDLSIKDILAIKQSGKGGDAKDILQANGYEKAASKDNVDYWTKNAELIQQEVAHGGGYVSVEYTAQPSKNVDGGSCVYLTCDANDNIAHFIIEVYSMESIARWKKQFEELGYTVDVVEGQYDKCLNEEEAHKKEKEGWSICTERSDGVWCDAMYFDKGDEELAIIDTGNNRFIIYF